MPNDTWCWLSIQTKVCISYIFVKYIEFLQSLACGRRAKRKLRKLCKFTCNKVVSLFACKWFIWPRPRTRQHSFYIRPQLVINNAMNETKAAISKIMQMKSGFKVARTLIGTQPIKIQILNKRLHLTENRKGTCHPDVCHSHDQLRKMLAFIEFGVKAFNKWLKTVKLARTCLHLTKTRPKHFKRKKLLCKRILLLLFSKL